VSRHVRKSDIVFGGMQVLVSGDFFQLPPVPNVLYGDTGEFAFESNIWKLAFPHTANLTEVVRQDEPDLILAVNELAGGTPSVNTLQLPERMKRPLPHSVDRDVHLFATNIQLKAYNADCLEQVLTMC
jgi:ATP-dependent DNA helicase PIF1